MVQKLTKRHNLNTNDFWSFIITAENAYSKHRKKIMHKFSLNAAETDILMFLANNPEFDTAAQISKVRMIPKSQVSVSIKSLCERGFLETFYKPDNKKSLHLILTKAADDIIKFGRETQKGFAEMLFCGFSAEEKNEFARLHMMIVKNIEKDKENK